MGLAWEQASLTADPIAFLREYVASRDFVRHCLHVAGSMVTAVQTDNGRTWREAAAKCFSWSNRDAILMLPERTAR